MLEVEAIVAKKTKH